MEEACFFEDLQALAAAAFPKHCNYCGRIYATADEFMKQTQSIGKSVTGLKQSFDDNNAIVEAYRNCQCGSTLMDFFSDRRDISAAGQHRRQLFDKLLPHLQQQKGMDKAAARSYLLSILAWHKA